MSRIFLLFAIPILFSACKTASKSDYERLAALPFQDLVYSHWDFENDSVCQYTLKTFVEANNVVVLLEERDKMKLFYQYTPYSINNKQDTFFGTTYLNYDLQGDSVLYLEHKEDKIGSRQQFWINGNLHTVLRQPSCNFCKVGFNEWHYFHEQYGWILIHSKYSQSTLLSIPNSKTATEILGQLIQQIEQDTAFSGWATLKNTPSRMLDAVNE